VQAGNPASSSLRLERLGRRRMRRVHSVTSEHLVIPAKAGIQRLLERPKSWIPAFAGKTDFLFVQWLPVSTCAAVALHATFTG
jgi:hypothetical protein